MLFSHWIACHDEQLSVIIPTSNSSLSHHLLTERHRILIRCSAPVYIRAIEARGRDPASSYAPIFRLLGSSSSGCLLLQNHQTREVGISTGSHLNVQGTCNRRLDVPFDLPNRSEYLTEAALLVAASSKDKRVILYPPSEVYDKLPATAAVASTSRYSCKRT